jgi:DHA1 family tetracycline resistance protein-like MFS transporter
VLRGTRHGSLHALPPGFGVIWTTVAVDLVGFGIVMPILPQYAERFGVSATVIGLLLSSFSLAQLVGAPILGRLSDRVGRKPVILVSLFGTAVGSLLTGAAGNVWVLFAGRLLDGASGASVSVAQAAVADLAPPERRARLMGLLGAAFGVGFVAGPALGALAALGGAHVPFFVAAAIAFVNGLVAIRRLPETRALASTAEAELDGEHVADAPALDGPGLVEPAHVRVPDDAGGADGDDVRGIVRLIGVAFAGMLAFSAFEATFALLADRRFDLHLSSTAAVFTAIGLALVAVQVGLVGPVTERVGHTATLRVGLVANGTGLVVLALDLGWGGLVLALALLVTGQGLITPTLASAVAGRAGPRRGQWLGWQQSAGGAARVLGPALGGALFQHVGAGAPYVAGAVAVGVALVLVPSPRQGWQRGSRRGTVEVTGR